jgi:hypothetical protein
MRLLHVANGTATTSIIRAAGIPGLRSQWADVLYEGPVPGGLTDEELVAVREDFSSDPTRSSKPTTRTRSEGGGPSSIGTSRMTR